MLWDKLIKIGVKAVSHARYVIFQLDRRYWESFWYYPKGDGPKLFANKKMHKLLTSPRTNSPWAKNLTKLQ